MTLAASEHGRLVYRDLGVAVYDDLLPPGAFEAIVRFVQGALCEPAEVRLPAGDGRAYVGWREGDGRPIRSRTWRAARRPFGNALDPLAVAVSARVTDNASLFGEAFVAWNDVSYRVSRYRAGERLSWHDDGVGAGAYTYYAHPKWSPTWGGELLVADVPARESLGPEAAEGALCNPDAWVNHLHVRGRGIVIHAAPNRLVLIRAGTEHAIGRIRGDVGERARCSVNGFVKRRDPAAGLLILGGG